LKPDDSVKDYNY